MDCSHCSSYPQCADVQAGTASTTAVNLNVTAGLSKDEGGGAKLEEKQG